MSDLILASPFTHHLVLQRGCPNPIWGWDRPGQAITLTVEGAPGAPLVRSGTALADGSWRLLCPELPAGGPYHLRVQGSTEAVLEDVLVGEVWLASGQSNMEWSVAQAGRATEEIRGAHWPALRMFKVANAAAGEPRARVAGEWRVCSSESVGQFSAVGYFFARELHQRLGVPVGILNASWGGTRVEAWTSVEALRPCTDVDAELARLELDDEQLERLSKEYRRTLTRWEEEHLPPDPGNRGEAEGWAKPDHDDSAWRSLPLPTVWQAHGMKFNGVVWFRRTLDLPEAWAGHDLLLSLGAIDDFDHSYLNGNLVGSHPKGTPGAFQLPRRYTVPGHLVRSGRNVIAVRVFDHFGEGGFLGPSEAMFVETAAPTGGRLSLTGPWHMAVEHELPLVPGSVFRSYPSVPAVLDRQNAPAALYHGMIAPLVPFGLRGAIWYQGESNDEGYRVYRDRFVALIRDFRKRWGLGTFPFYFVQLAAHLRSQTWPYLREAQVQALTEPHTGMAVAIDIGDPDNIHPANKQEVGRRLALLALKRDYGAQIEDSGPVFQRAVITGGSARVYYRHAAGLHTTGGDAKVSGFSLAGADGVYHPAEARVEGETVVAASLRVPEPCTIRYAWAECPDVNLVNGSGLPAVPFRTDGY